MDVSIDRNPDAPLTLAVPQPDTKNSKPVDDIRLMVQKPAPPKPPVAPPKPPVAQPPPPKLASQPDPRPIDTRHTDPRHTDFRQTFEDFANPRKLKPPQSRDKYMDEIGDEDDDYDDDNDETGSMVPSDAGSDDVSPPPSEFTVEEPEDPDEPDYLKPSEGFRTIDEEKASLIFKLARAKRAGMPSSRNFTMASDIRDMRAEMARIEHELALDGSLKFQRKMLMMTVSVIEHMNNRYDPFELQLNGWSESVHSSLGDYDRVFERLHEKYKSKVQMAPEIELLFMLAGSAMMFHFTKTIFKQGLPGMSANPELMQSMMKAFAQSQAQQPQAPQRPPQPPPQQPPPSAPPSGQQGATQPQRREMRGPSMDIGGLLGGLGGLGGAMPFPPMPPPQPSRPPSLQISDAPEKSQAPAPAKKAVSFAAGTKRPLENDDAEGEDERLSDVVSDLESVPDDLSSFGSDTSSEDGNIKTIQVKKRGGKKSKNVITL